MVFTIKTFEKKGLKELSVPNQKLFIKEFMAHSRQVIHTITWLILTMAIAGAGFLVMAIQNKLPVVVFNYVYFGGLAVYLFVLIILIKMARDDMFHFLEILKGWEKSDKARRIRRLRVKT